METPHLQRGALDLYPSRRHHAKPGPRLDPTRLRGGGGNILTYSASNWIGVDPPS